MRNASTAQSIVEVLTDTLAGPYLLGYVVIALALTTMNGLLAVIGSAMILLPLVAALFLN